AVPLIALALAGVSVLSLSQLTPAQQPVTLTVRVDQPGVKIDPLFYGLMTEEINYSYDGGLYAELIRNRTFRNNAQNPENWSVAKYDGGEGSITLENDPVPNTALTRALKLGATALKAKQRVGVANEGYWGIPVRPDAVYRASFYAKAASGFKGPLTVAIESNDGKIVHAKANVGQITSEWKKYSVTLRTAKPVSGYGGRIDAASSDPGSITNRFVIST